MKKTVALMLAIVLCLSVFAGCGAQDQQNQTDLGGTQQEAKEKVVVGLDDSFPPMGFRDEKTNELVGVDIDLIKAVGEKMGVEMELKPIDWKTKEMELNSKKIDIIWNGYTITDERKEQVAFSHPYMDNAQIIVVSKDSDIKAKADLAGKKVGVQGGSSGQDAVEADAAYASIGEENLRKYDTIPMALMDLEAGRVDAVVADEVVVNYYLAKMQKDHVILSDNFGTEEYGIGFRKDDTELLNKVEDAFKALMEDGTMEKISNEWFGKMMIKYSFETEMKPAPRGPVPL